MCADRAVKYQLIQHRLLEPQGSEPDFTRGTLEGDIAASDITFYRLQCDSEGTLRAYIAQGEVLPVATGSFGGIGVFAIHEMGRFYRHVLVAEALSAPRRGRLRPLRQGAVRSVQVPGRAAISPTTSPRRSAIRRRILSADNNPNVAAGLKFKPAALFYLRMFRFHRPDLLQNIQTRAIIYYG